MEASFSPISSCAAVSSFLYPRCRCVRSLRKEFLGNGHNLRPPAALRSRRKCKNLGFQFHLYPRKRFVFRASLDSQSIALVAAVVAVSALTVFYLNYSKRKKNGEEKKVYIFNVDYIYIIC